MESRSKKQRTQETMKQPLATSETTQGTSSFSPNTQMASFSTYAPTRELVETSGMENPEGLQTTQQTAILPGLQAEIQPLTKEESEAVEQLLRPGGSGGIEPVRLTEDELGTIKTALGKAATAQIAKFDEGAFKATTKDKLPDAYDDLKKLAIQKVLALYSPMVQATAKESPKMEMEEQQGSILATAPDQIHLQTPIEKWKAYQQSAKEIDYQETASAAITYYYGTKTIMDTVTKVAKQHLKEVKERKQMPEKLKKDQQKQLVGKIIAGVQENARATLLKDNVLVLQLAQARIRWSPTTEGDYITIAADNISKNMGMAKNLGDTKIKTVWAIYQKMVHEVIHTAEHPVFKKYRSEVLPSDAQNTVHEGVTEYFAFRAWKQIVNELEKSAKDQKKDVQQKLQKEVEVVYSIVDELKNQEFAGEKEVEDLKGRLDNSFSLYPGQLAIIESIVNMLKGGDDRLRAAYFYGRVEQIFPATFADQRTSDVSHNQPQEDRKSLGNKDEM